MAKKILIVEDELNLIFLMRDFLEGNGYAVTEAHNGREGVAAAREGMPDLIIMDIMLPEMDGLTATQEIRKDPRLSKIPILVSTAKGQMRPFFTSEAKVEGYLEKPFQLKEMLAEIKKLLGESA